MKDVKQAARSFGNHYAVIYEQVFASIRYGFLKKRNHPKQYRICHLSENALSSLGAMNLQENSERGESVILVVQKLPPANPIITIQRILRESGKIGLKCHLYLMLDDNVPSFSLDNNLYREQIDREMTVNVLRKGKWGSYYKLPVPKSIHEEVDQLVTFVNHPTEVDLKFIGLNPVVRELGKEEASTVLDYSGISLSGHNVMGIAYKPKGFGRNLSLDPIFQWTVPPSFPLIGAAALPSAYLMAHVIMDKILRVPIKKTAFILNGQTPIGIACISLCLNMGYDVFATVPNKAARKLLMILFPEMSESHITDHNNEDFYVPVMFATGGIGADIIISDLPRRQMLVAWKCIGEFGCFVNLNEETMDHNAPLPMGRFNECNGYYSFKQSSLKDLPKEHKLRLHALVSESLASGRIVHIPHQILDTDNLNQLPRSVELITEQGGKLILDVSNDCTGKKTHKPTREKRNGLNGHSEWIANGDAHQTYIILTETAGKAVNIIDWLLERGVKKIVMATLDMRGGESAIRKINNSTIKHDAMFLMVSNDMMKTASGVKKLLGKAERLGKISTILAISLDEHVDILSNVGDELKQLKNDCSLINIQAATSTYESDDMVTIVCSDDVDCSHALGQAMTDPDKTATYVVSSKIENRLNDSAPGACEKLTDYLPSSIHELEEMGADLCLRDSQIDIRNSAEFLYTPSLSPRTATEIDDVLPVFIVPAFCQTQLKPLISKLIYPCYVAHVHPEAGSTEQVASHLLESMLKIQRRGPYTLVGETWSGGLAILLAKLLTDAKLEVSLFLLQGVPQRFLSLLPPRESLNAHLIKLLFELDDEKNPEVFEEPDETKRLDKVVESLPFNKDFLRRSFKAIQRQIESLKSSQDHSISLNNDIFLMEVSRFCKLSVIEVETMSEKRGQLVKIDCENYKKMLSNPQLSAKIAEEAPFTW
ncbi:fatty acid synthase [Bemisia tabaci]